jgi:type VI secretion system protein ImpA
VIVHYLREHWEDVNPKGEDGSFDERNGTLEWLDEFQSTILPLHYAPLVRSGAGTLTLRDKVVALGSASAREGERLKDEAAIAEILQAARVEELSALHTTLTGIAADLDAVRSVFNEKTGFMQAPSFDRLPAAIKIAITMVGESLTARGHAPAESTPPGGQPIDEEEDETGGETGGGQTRTITVTLASGRVTSAAAARAALGAADDYFGRSEPSSPARLLVRQARELIGLSFHEVLERIAPQRLADPIVRLGTAGDVVLSVESMASATGSPAHEEAEETSADAFEASTRPEALAILKDVSAFFRAAEPSSPVPVLLDRASALMTMDFQKLLAELAGPEESSSSSDW